MPLDPLTLPTDTQTAAGQVIDSIHVRALRDGLLAVNNDVQTIGVYAKPSPWPVDARASLNKQSAPRVDAARVEWLIDSNQALPANFNDGTTNPDRYPGDYVLVAAATA